MASDDGLTLPVPEQLRKRSRTRSPERALGELESSRGGEAELIKIKKRLVKARQLRGRGSESLSNDDVQPRPAHTSILEDKCNAEAGPSSPEPSQMPVRSLSIAGISRQAQDSAVTTQDLPQRSSHVEAKTLPRSLLAPRRSQHPPISSCRSVYCYTRLNHIEEGTYGIVFRAKCNDTGGIYALKKLKLEEEKQGFPITSLREVMALMVAGSHENIVGVREIVVGDTLNQCVLV